MTMVTISMPTKHCITCLITAFRHAQRHTTHMRAHTHARTHIPLLLTHELCPLLHDALTRMRPGVCDCIIVLALGNGVKIRSVFVSVIVR